MDNSQFLAYLEGIWDIPPEDEQKLLDESFKEEFDAWYRGEDEDDEDDELEEDLNE